MKKILLATTLLAASTGFAAAEVALSGDARMGVVSGFDDPLTLTVDESTIAFTSRARVKFTLTGETDGGLAFGGSFRADNAGGAASGDAGSVFISGAFGKLSMGDVDGAAKAAVGHVSGVGLTALGDLNESTFIAKGLGFAGTNNTSMALYEYSTGDLTIYASVTNPGVGDPLVVDSDAYSVAAKYALGDYTVSLGYEAVEERAGPGSIDHIVLGGTAKFGAVTVKANYGIADLTDLGLGSDATQWAVSVDYAMDALTVTAFYTDDSEMLGAEAYGLGAAYDLGGGAKVVGGYAKNQTTDQDAFDLGVAMTF